MLELSQMLKQLILGVVLFGLGLFFGSHGRRPWIDYDFILSWYGILVILDFVNQKLKGKSIFRPFENFLLLAMVSSVFWWFYEWANIYLKNWDYPVMFALYNQLEFGVIATIAFSTVIPFLILVNNTVAFLLFKGNYDIKGGNISKNLAGISVALGIICFVLTITIPLYSFPLIWFSLFLLLDPINAVTGRRSLIVQFAKRNYRIFLILGVSALLAGLTWETMNYLLPKWIYPIVPWFWGLPAPITTKYVQMPFAGFLGYIPFVWSAFALLEYLRLPIKILPKD